MVRKRIQVVAAIAAGALATTVAIALATAAPSYAAGDAYALAPYTDMSNSQESILDTAITQHGLKAYTAAFVIGAGCNQTWGDTLPVGNDSYIDPEIAKAKSEGASVIISSGGAGGEPLAWTCTTQSSIDAGYQNIIKSYNVTSLDFDVEGAAVPDTAAVARHMQAMKDLKASNPGLKFSMTLPVLPDGLTADSVNIITAAKNAGLKIDVVNVMAMDYYQGSQDMGQAAIKAAQSTLAQMKSVDPSYTYANLGITPMIGVNDDGSIFTLANASTLESWAASNGVGRLAFWSEDRDQPCSGGSAAASPICSGVSAAKLAFTDAFVPFAGGGGNPPPSSPPPTTSPSPSPTATPTASPPPGGCSASAWNSATAYTGGALVSYTGHTWKAKWWTQGEAPSTSGTGVWADQGACTGTPSPTRSPSPTPTVTPTSTPSPTPSPTPPAGNLVANPGLETGSLSPWTCAAGTGSVVASPAHTGSHALAAAASGSSTAQCSQTITVSPGKKYTLTGYVQGSYAYLGVSGTGTPDASAWTASAPSWTKMSVAFTTGASTHTVTIYTHGWYGQGTIYADDFTVA